MNESYLTLLKDKFYLKILDKNHLKKASLKTQ